VEYVHGPTVHESMDCIELESLNLGCTILIERREGVFSPSNLNHWLQNKRPRFHARREAAALRAGHGGCHCHATRACQREQCGGSSGFFFLTTTAPTGAA
jgi:hypothetical protein